MGCHGACIPTSPFLPIAHSDKYPAIWPLSLVVSLWLALPRPHPVRQTVSLWLCLSLLFFCWGRVAEALDLKYMKEAEKTQESPGDHVV